ncbi:MAG TPA: 3-methyl-2-oxobutanoate dehydrogenase subunit VorB [Candidatus Limnocylindria bacterium]|nr:3-methyl-2-oxobutanoate dehydrogenase subunit VorB [Candidatus Limnocylindria bacterium]
MSKELWKGNEAIGEAAIRAGCMAYFGYPITPQNEIPEYMSRRMPEEGRVFLQAESEIAAVNMVYGAAAAGVRAMTSSSSPGISLKQEGISYLIGAELPAVIINMMRGGPGLGTIQPGQADYFQATRSPGHGDGHMVVLAPAGIQEAADLMQDAFDLADKYRTPVMLLADGMIGQMMEPIEWREREKIPEPEKPWAADGRDGDMQTHFVTSLRLQSPDNERFVLGLADKYAAIRRDETRFEQVDCEGADVIITAFGTTARIALSAARKLRAEGIRAGLFRPITLWPWPGEALANLAAQPSVKAVLTVEMSLGQMVEDVRLAVLGARPVYFYGRTGGMVPDPASIAQKVRDVLQEVKQ